MRSRPTLISLLLVTAATALLMAASPCYAALTGVIAGTVADQQTGKTLAGANISLSPIGYTTVSDSQGDFLFTAVPPGEYTLTASLVGYADLQMVDLSVTQDHTTHADIALVPAEVEAAGAEAIVTAARVNIHPEQAGSTYIVTSEEEQTTISHPNDRYQFPGLVFNQPGVVPDSTFFPHIRGARENQVGYMIDGIPIVEPNNNVFATNLVTVGLNRMELLTGGWDAQYGSQVGGVINEVVKRGDQVLGGYIEAAAGTPTNLHQFIVESGDAGTKPGSSWYFASNVWGSEFPGDSFLTKAPLSLDGIFKGVMPISENNSLTLLANHGYASYRFHYPHTRGFNTETGLFEDVEEAIDNSNQGYNLDAITLSHAINPKSYWTARLYRLNNYITIDAGSDIFMIFQRRQQRMWGAQLDYVRQMSQDHMFYAGVWKIDSQNRWRNGMDMPPFFGPFDQEANNNTKNLQMYIQDTRRIAPRTELGLGLRYETMNYDRPEFGDLNLSATSPRVGLTYELVPSKLLVRASAGRYIQFPPAARTGVLFRTGDPESPFDPPSWYMFQKGRSDLKPQKDTNQQIGLEYKLDNNTLVMLSAFRRTSEDMLQKWAGASDDTDDFDPDAAFHFASNGRGKYQGIELKVDRKLSNNVRAWVAYTRLDAKATASAENVFPSGIALDDPEELFPVDWDQRDTVSVVVNWKMKKMSISPWFIWGSGFPITLQSGQDIDPDGGFNFIHDEFDNEIPIVLNGKVQQPSDIGKFRTGRNFVLSLNMSFNLKKDSEFFVEVYNILDRRDVTNMVWYHTDSGAILGQKPPDATYPNGHIEYVPFTTTLPRSITFGFRQAF